MSGKLSGCNNVLYYGHMDMRRVLVITSYIMGHMERTNYSNAIWKQHPTVFLPIGAVPIELRCYISCIMCCLI